MAERSDHPVPGRNLQGQKYLERLPPLFDRLHDVGCQRGQVGDRQLHFDRYCALILLFLLNPVLLSFRPGEWTMRDFLRGVAGPGGFLGRKSDGEPGWITIWRGWEVLN